MSNLDVDRLLERFRARLSLSSETERELLEEIRTHLEDALADAQAGGIDEETALMKVAERFGLDETGSELQKLHQGWESADAIIACAVPVLAALVMRWIIFAPDGTALGWPELLVRPAFWVVAVVALLAPLIRFSRWRYALVGWGLFWALTVIFITFPAISRW
jgi:hypothetical protein